MPPTPRAAEKPPAEPETAVDVTLETVDLKADAAMAQALAIAEEAGELLGALSKRVADLESAQSVDVTGLADRVATLERHVTVPVKQEAIPSRALCDDCGAPMDGQHFDDCQHLPGALPKGPRGTAARVGAEA